MKHLLSLLLFLVLKSVSTFGQDTTRILFVGNSFTYFNNMPQMVKALADSAKIPMTFAMHAPGGISVGDISQGNQAHMNNPALYALIRSKKWDVMVLQDNQGRFVRDSAQFPATTTSKVVEGHIRLMDSLKANNSCAKVVLFGGWGLKNGMPPYGNTGEEVIRRILRNYVVLNDTMKEVVSPIGEAWLNVINQLPSVDLWDADQAHPSFEGSYLTAVAIFSTVFDRLTKNINYTAGIPAGTAKLLRQYSDTVLAKPSNVVKYNQGAIANTTSLAFSGNQFTVTAPGPIYGYKWYKNKFQIGNSPIQSFTGNGWYYALVKRGDSSWVKTCGYDAVTLGVNEENVLLETRIFPNPSSGSTVWLTNYPWPVKSIRILNSGGKESMPAFIQTGSELKIMISNLEQGFYTIQVKSEFITRSFKLLLRPE